MVNKQQSKKGDAHRHNGDKKWVEQLQRKMKTTPRNRIRQVVSTQGEHLLLQGKSCEIDGLWFGERRTPNVERRSQ